MAYKVPRISPMQELNLGVNSKWPLDGGLCLDEPSSISLTQSASSVNMCLDDGGVPKKRPGQTNLHNTSLGSGHINAVYPSYKGKTIIAYNQGIYTQVDNNDMVQIYSGITNSKAIFFTYNNLLYFMNGYEFLKYDGNSVTTVTPYIPRHSYNCKPDGSNATIDESWNLIGTGFRRQFTGDGTSKDYILPYQNLDATPVTAIVNGVNKVEGTDFTVDRVNGKITFNVAPSTGGTLNPNNVEITAFKSFSGYKNQIINCTVVQEAYSVLFLSGNSNIPNQYWVSGLNSNGDASYFPYSRIFQYGATDKSITTFSMYQDQLLIFKENEFSRIEQVTSPTGIDTFNRVNINNQIGCDCPMTMKLVSDRPTWLTTYAGVQTLETLMSGVKSCISISQNVNGNINRAGLMQESLSDLEGASSFDYAGKYGIALLNGHCYVWEYERGYTLSNSKSMKWFYWENIYAVCFFSRNNQLIYGHSQRGQLCKFTDQLNDFGAAISAVFTTKLYDFGDPSYYKYAPYCYITTRANSGSSLDVEFINDQHSMDDTENIPNVETSSLDLSNVNYDNFIWDVQLCAPTILLTPLLQDIRYLEIQFTNNNANEDLSIVAIALTYQITRRVV